MKLFIQIILIALIILILLFIYNKYFVATLTLGAIKDLNINNKQVNQNNYNNVINDINIDKKIVEKNNKIKNLSYEINLSNSNKYIINSDASELIYKDDKEIVNMKNVEAILIDKNNKSLNIKSDEAIFDSSNNNTKFKSNIKIKYLDNIILSDSADLNLLENYILIYENAVYQNPRGSIKTYNIKFDLITKNVFMFMNNDLKKIQMTAN